MPAPTRTTIRTKSVYDPAEPSDGRRVLATRYWPRGVRRDAIDEYVPALAPSRELLRAFKDGRAGWEEFRTAYLEEMGAPAARAELDRLASETGPLTLLCVCREAERPDGRPSGRCHRTLLAGLITGEKE